MGLAASLHFLFWCGRPSPPARGDDLHERKSERQGQPLALKSQAAEKEDETNQEWVRHCSGPSSSPGFENGRVLHRDLVSAWADLSKPLIITGS